MDLAIGQVYGEKYKIVRLLGQGSMGAVYEGENVRIRRKVAIKTLHPGMAEKGDTLQRFEREAQAAGRIGSKHIVEVLDMGDLPDGSRYMVMEHLEGVTLQQHIKTNGRVRPIEASAIVQQLLEGLGAAHAAGIIHRDLKPANVFLVRHAGRAELVKILDFGVSKFSVLSGEMSMTRTGAVLGTPYYMSPEQAKGSRDTDGRSDLYAVGVILYECITGQVPFSAETFNELLFRIVLESPPPAESFVPDLSPELAAIIRKAMAREPGERYQTAQELKQALAEWSAKAEEAESPSFDGLATLDHQTVMRQTPFGQGAGAAPAAKPAGLRPAPPSITAGGTVMVGPGNAPKPSGLAALGTVIIDPSVSAPGATPAPPNGAPGNRAGGQKGAKGASPATQPLPQWQEGATGSGGAPAGMAGAPGMAGPGAAGYSADARGVYPAPVAGDAYGAAAPPQPYGAPGVAYASSAAQPQPYGGDAYGSSAAKPTARMAPQRPQNAVKVMAFLGIVTGLLAGVAAWAVLWRQEDPEPASETSEATASPSGSASAAAAGSVSSGSAAATPASSGSGAAGDVTSAAASAAAPSAEPTGAPAANAAAASSGGGGVEPVLSGGPAATSPKATSKASAAVSAKATASSAPTSAPGKPGKTNPTGGRTVTSDL